MSDGGFFESPSLRVDTQNDGIILRMTEKGGLKWHYWFREIVLHKSCYYIFTIYRLIRNMGKKSPPYNDGLNIAEMGRS